MSRPEPYSACWTLPDHVDRAAALWPANEALVFGDERCTFEQFADATFEFARALVTLGVEPGDRVGVLLPSGVAAFIALYGAARVGAIGVPLDMALGKNQLRDIARHAQLKVLIADDDVETPDTPTIEHELRPGADIQAYASETPGAEVRRRQRSLALGDTALLLYNGLLGAQLGHEGLVRTARILAEQRLPMESTDRLFNPLPFASLGSIQAFNGCLAVGSAFVGLALATPEPPEVEDDTPDWWEEGDEPAEELEAPFEVPEDPAALAALVLVAERCTLAIPALDTLWAEILDHADELPDLWLVAVNGDPELLRATSERLPDVTHVAAYGTTEVGGLIAVSDVDDPLELRIGSSGRPFPGLEIRIVDPQTGDELPAGERGRIAVKGWSLFQGYHEELGPHVDIEGFLHTEDQGSMDAGGRLFLGDVTFVR